MLDAFAGIGGFHLGVESACKELGIPFECVGAIEKDKDAIQTYSTNFPSVPIFQDITQLDVSTLPDFDILTGGFPCPSFSINGKNHLDLNSDPRAFLYLNLVNILKHKQPYYFIFENVANIENAKFEDGCIASDVITQDFIACGYKVVGKVLDSADFGVPQQRKRKFWVGIRQDIEKEYTFPEAQSRGVSVENILDFQFDEKYLAVNLWRNRTLLDITPDDLKTKFKKHPHSVGAPRLEVLKWLYENNKRHPIPGKISLMAAITGDTPSGVSRQHDRVYSIKGIYPTIATFGISLIDSTPWRSLTPREYHRLQGFPDSYIINPKENAAYKQAGNAVTVNVIKMLAKNLLV
jgi:DNA (cytosine-5)-methyltransferase 1